MDKVRYKCGKCGYDFTRNKIVSISKCPYCGKEAIELVKGDYASKLLEEDQ